MSRSGDSNCLSEGDRCESRAAAAIMIVPSEHDGACPYLVKYDPWCCCVQGGDAVGLVKYLSLSTVSRQSIRDERRERYERPPPVFLLIVIAVGLIRLRTISGEVPIHTNQCTVFYGILTVLCCCSCISPCSRTVLGITIQYTKNIKNDLSPLFIPFIIYCSTGKEFQHATAWCPTLSWRVSSLYRYAWKKKEITAYHAYYRDELSLLRFVMVKLASVSKRYF